ncbi:MAG: ATP--guanido phosphotransferase [Clostridia bacterium]|nr:ATP--guanido phosphotransferase [Clostridia bacterium]MBR2286631.1 ATP--guanido phosphotransferase [Clostridia bacterium]
MQNLTAVSSRVRLARNFTDFPFDLTKRPEDAEAIVQRTVNALAAEGMGDAFHFFPVRELTEGVRRFFAESHLISEDLLRHAEVGAVLMDETHGVSVMMLEDDHLRIQALEYGDDVRSAAGKVLALDDTLSRQLNFAFDRELGYLTACPTDTGTGMRASMQVHLPLLTYFKQMGSVGQTVAKVGLNIRGVYGEGSEALGSLYQISNQATLGRTEQEIINTVVTVGNQLAEMEEALRARIMDEQRTQTEDKVYRAFGTLNSARLLPLKEFYELWSTVRLGMLLGLIRRDLPLMDGLIKNVQERHLAGYAERPLTKEETNMTRALRVRETLREAGITEQDGE